MKKPLRIALAVIFTGTFLFSTYMIFQIMQDYKVGDETYSELNNDFVTIHKVEDLPKETHTASPKPTAGASIQPDQEPPPKKPEVSLEVDFEKLTELNGDIIGWLYSEDTVISLPVVQSSDNAYYLRRLIDGKYNRNGTLFLDYRIQSDFSGKNSVIYGHNMKNESMFGTLPKYKKQDYYDKHPVMYYLTPDQNYRIELFAGYTTNALSDTYTFSFENEDSFNEYIEAAIGKSTFKSDVTVAPEDRILTLSTCTYEFDIARYVLMGKLVPIDSSSPSA